MQTAMQVMRRLSQQIDVHRVDERALTDSLLFTSQMVLPYPLHLPLALTWKKLQNRKTCSTD